MARPDPGSPGSVAAGALAASMMLAGSLVLGACGGGAPDASGRAVAASPDASVPAGTCLPQGPAGSATAAAPPAAGSRAGLPDLVLACFDGSGRVPLRTIGGPAVVNLWASWCAPCRRELPAFQAYARRAAGRVAVIGVDTADTRDAGRSLIQDLSLTFPMLVDDRAELGRALGRTALPLTLFVDGYGRVTHLYQREALDEDRLAALVAEHLGVVLPR
jgi:thiol-disulfide isomerase/thioredoxin